MKKFKATIRWFDSMRGEGMVRLTDIDKSVYFHFTALYKPSNGNYHYPSQYMQSRLPELVPVGQLVDVWIDSDNDVVKVIPVY